MSLPQMEALTRELEDRVSAYLHRTGEPPPQPKGFSRLFRRWLSYSEQETEPIHRDFLSGVTALTEELAQTGATLPPEDRQEAGKLAERALACLLQTPPAGLPNERKVYLAAVQAAGVPLLPLLDQVQLARQRDALLAQTPRRLLFPRQRELLEEMERKLKP